MRGRCASALPLGLTTYDTVKAGDTARMISQIKQWTDKPVRFLVNTHCHPDHNAGNGLNKEAYPGLQIVSTPAARTGIENELPRKEVKEDKLSRS